MLIVRFIVSLVITIALVFVLNSEWSAGGKPIPPIGKFLSPQQGFWQNADVVNKDFNSTLHFPQLSGDGEVFIDERLVPHVFVTKENDAYFIQGYLHAKFRLWQMEFQVYAAAGRISELIGEKGLNFDRDKRRLGMVYAAERSLAEMEKDSTTHALCDAYTAGVNAYIENLNESDLPVEYKLLNYRPEKWTNLKSALFLKYMSLDLAGSENDFEYSNARSFFGMEDFEKMYPYAQDSLDPIVPKNTVYAKPALTPLVPAHADSVYFGKKDSINIVPNKPDHDNGSNNWAVSGKKTKSGAPILCNDPHLGLNLPSLWFEMQLSTHSFNAYGATFPGSPGVIIGFNDSCAFGFTNAERDVRDYYEIKFRDETMKEYWFGGEWKSATFRYDTFRIKNKGYFIDTVAYTIFGPVMYDKKFAGGRNTGGKSYAVRWKAHDPSNDLKCFIALDHAKNYTDYSEAIKYLHTPGQNCIFASKGGDIAIWDQGEFPARWKRQGDFVMPGTDSSYMWQGMIPQDENPHQINPDRGFVSSANQLPVDPAAYPYYLAGSFPPYRGLIINRYLSHMQNITAEDMMSLQTENYNVFAEMARPLILKNIDESQLNEVEKKQLDILKTWNLRDDIGVKGCTVFTATWDSLEHIVWADELEHTGVPMVYPYESTLLEALIKDSSFKFVDNITTTQKETLRDDMTAAFKLASAHLQKLDADGKEDWDKFKDTRINHLARLEPFSRLHLPIGGGTNCINATKSVHGPSWRMIVQLSSKTVAYGVYPGGQDGNPGSPNYDNFVDQWAAGKYYPLWMMTKEEEQDSRVKFTMHFKTESQ